MKVTINFLTTKNKISVSSHYNSLFVKEARNLGGDFNRLSSQWEFDARDEAEVRELCYRIFGEDGVRTNFCDILVKFKKTYYADRESICVLGFPVARAFGRDSGARLTPGVAVKQGGFKSGGSVKNWCTVASADTVIMLRDISRVLAEEYIQNQDEDSSISIEIISTTSSIDTLVAEREKLLARLAEINTQLADAAS